MLEEIERVKRSMRAEIVPYGAYEPEAPRSVKIRVERGRARGGDGAAAG